MRKATANEILRILQDDGLHEELLFGLGGREVVRNVYLPADRKGARVLVVVHEGNPQNLGSSRQTFELDGEILEIPLEITDEFTEEQLQDEESW